MLQDQISKQTLACDEDNQSNPKNQDGLALEKEEQIVENAVCCKRTICNNEETIGSIEKPICAPANQLMCMQTDSEPDYHPPETAPSVESYDGQEKMHLLPCSTPLCITNIVFHQLSTIEFCSCHPTLLNLALYSSFSFRYDPHLFAGMCYARD